MNRSISSRCLIATLLCIGCGGGGGGSGGGGSSGASTDGAGGAGPGPAGARTCSLYQKYEFDAHPDAYEACTDVRIPYDDIVPHESNGHLWSRTVPKCIDGTDEGCAGTEVRCIDGTRPFYHLDKAMDPDGNPVDSDKWIFFFPGGGSCGATQTTSAAEICSSVYALPGEAAEMSTRHADPAVKPIAAREATRGILDGDPSGAFAGYNRVRVFKCSYDRFSGNTTHVDAERGTTLYFHGRKIIQAVFADLSRSRGTVSDASDGDLPSLADAATVLVAGNSGGSGGLIMNADWIAGLLQDATEADVRFVFDARLEPNPESEARFEDGGGAGLYAGDTEGVSTLDNGASTVSITRSFATFAPGGRDRANLDSRGDAASEAEPYLDASCFAAHRDDPTPCYDEGHVLFHHLSVNRFMYQSLRDKNHRDNAVGWVTAWTHSPDVFSWMPDEPKELQFRDAFTDRVVYTADQFFRFRASADETPAPVYDLVVMIPGHDKHVNITDNHYFRVASMSHGVGGGKVTRTFERALAEWVEDGGSAIMVDDRATTEKALDGGGWSTAH
jgi:hypothetical protein